MAVDPSPVACESPGSPSLTLSLPPAATSLAVARAVIRRVVAFVHDDAESRFLTAFTDLMINAIEEHERHGISDDILVSASLSLEPTITIMDRGSGYEVPDGGATGPTPPIGHTGTVPETRGRGVALALSLVPGITFDSSAKGTTVTLPLAGLVSIQ